MDDQANIKFALRNLAAFAAGFIPSRLPGPAYEPEREDAKAFIEDLTLIAKRTDALVLAYGEYLQSHGVVSTDDVKKLFTDQLGNALEGNALYAIESGVEDRIEARREAAAEDRAERRRELARESAP